MFCMECGEELLEGAKFCQACGASLKKKCNTSDSGHPNVKSEGIECTESGSNVQLTSGSNNDRMMANIAKLKAKFMESKIKMEGKRVKRGKKEPETCTGLETLEVRFVDKDERRLQRIFPEGATSLNIEVEDISTLDDWMQMVASMFKTEFTMHPVILKDGSYQELPSGTTLANLKKGSKGKHKNHGFYVKVYAKFFTHMEMPPLAGGELQIFPILGTQLHGAVRDLFRASTYCDTGPWFIGSHPKEQSPRPTKNQSSDIEKTSQLAEKTGLSKESQPSKIHCISDSSEDDFEDPKKKKSEKCPQTSTPECGTPCKMEDDAELPILSRSKRIKRKISSPGQSPIKNDSFEELPDLAVPVMSEKDTDGNEIADSENDNDNGEDDYMKDFTEMMQKKRERQLLAESTVIDFPSDKEGKQVSVVYQDHGGLGFTRPFKTSDTVKNVYSWIISEVDPEILPPVFHFECAAPTKCNNKTCPHIYELAADHLVTIDHLPDVLYLREGCFAVNDTFTGLGDVLI